MATPCYRGELNAYYVHSLLSTLEYSKIANFNIDPPNIIANDCLLIYARNAFIAKFLANPKYTHLLFVDADMKWNPTAIDRLLENDKDVVGTFSNKRNYHWDYLYQMMNDQAEVEHIRSLPPDAGIKYIKDIVSMFVGIKSSNNYVDNGKLEADAIGAGFMLIKRKVLEDLYKTHTHRICFDDHHFLKPEETLYNAPYFECQLIPEDGGNRLISEDFTLCRKIKDLGYKIYIDLRVTIGHVGDNLFEGSILSKMRIV